MNRRQVLTLGGVGAAAAMLELAPLTSTLLSSGADRSARKWLVVTDPRSAASTRFAALLERAGAHILPLDGNSLRTWNEQIQPLARNEAVRVTGVTDSAEADFFADAGREVGLRHRLVSRHRQMRDGWLHTVPRDERLSEQLKLSGDQWPMILARKVLPVPIGKVTLQPAAMGHSKDWNDLTSWELA